MTNNALIVAAKSALPSLGNNVTYSDAAKMFLSPGYTSAAGNTYQEGLRLSRYIAVDYSIGHGYCRSFLNGVKLYIWDNNKPKLVAHRTFDCYFLSESAIKYETERIVKEHLKNSCKVLGLGNATDSELTRLSQALVSETMNTTQLIGHAG
jgi:hypothetical protein